MLELELNSDAVIITELREAFGAFDKENKGQIASCDLGHVMGKLGLKPTEDEISKMVARFSRKGTNTFCIDLSLLRFVLM